MPPTEVEAPGVEGAQLQFDPATHVYTRGGIVLPSVTQVLSGVGIIDTNWFTEAAAWRGSVVHRCCQLDDEGDLDEESIPEEVKGYLDAWRLCRSELEIASFAYIEDPMSLGDYAGTADRIIPPRRVLDLKTGAILPWVGIQLAAYGELAFGSRATAERIAVRLKPDGKYQICYFPLAERRRDLALFHSALAIYNWRNNKWK